MTRCLQQPQAERPTRRLTATSTHSTSYSHSYPESSLMTRKKSTNIMPQGPVNTEEEQELELDFSNVGKPQPAGRHPGQTGTWKWADNKPDSAAGAGKHILANIVIKVPSTINEDGKRATLFTRYFLNEDSLWKFKQDMVALGADPADLEGSKVKPGVIMRQIWGQVPTPLWATIDESSHTPPGGTERKSNDIKKLELRDESES